MRTEVELGEVGPKGGLFIRSPLTGEKRYLSQMPSAQRDAILQSSLPESVTVNLKRNLGGVETATITLRPFKFGAQTRWVLDTVSIKQPGLLHDATVTIKNPHNTRKLPEVSAKRGMSEHGKAGLRAAGDETLYRLLAVDGGLTAVIDGGGEIVGEAAKGFLKSVLGTQVPGLGSVVDAAEGVSKNDWGMFADALVSAGSTAAAVCLLELPVEVESTLFAGSTQSVAAGSSLDRGAYTGDTHFRGLGVGVKGVIGGVGLQSTEEAHADGGQTAIKGLGARVKAGKTFEANLTSGLVTKTSAERSWKQDGLQHTEVESVTKLGVRGAVRVADRESAATVPTVATLATGSSTTTIHTVKSGVGTDARPVETLAPDAHTLGTPGNLLHSTVSGEVVERTTTTTKTSRAGGAYKSAVQHTTERLQLAEETTASFDVGPSGHTTIMRAATGQAVDDRGLVASSSVGWAFSGPGSDGTHARGAEREVTATFAQAEHTTDVGSERFEVGDGRLKCNVSGGSRTSGIEHSEFAFTEERHSRTDGADGAFSQTSETVSGTGSRDKVLDPTSGKVAITAESQGKRTTVELEHTEATNFFRTRVHETATIGVGIEERVTEHQADALPTDGGPALAFDDPRTAKVVTDTPTYTAFGGQHLETDVNANLLFTKTTIQVQDLDANGVAIPGTSFREVEIQTSVHVNAGIESATVALRDDAICFLINTRAGKPTAADIARHVGTAITKGFATSVVASKLAGVVNPATASNFAAATVSATFELVHGHSQAAAKIAFEAAANEALHSVLGETLQLSYGQRTTIANGGLFGSKIKSAVIKSYNLDAPVPGVPGMTAGVHVEKQNIVFVDRKGRTVHHEGCNVGGHVAAGPVSVGVSLSHGTEVAEPTVREDGEFTITETWQRSFSGELNARLSRGDRMATLRLPAWKSTTVEWKFTRRTDGEPLRVTQNLPLRHLAPVAADGPGVKPSADPAVVGGTEALPTTTVPGGSAGDVAVPGSTTQSGGAAAAGDASALLQHTLACGGTGTDRVYEMGEKKTTDRRNLGTKKKRIYETWESGTRTDVTTDAGVAAVTDDGIHRETASREEVHVNYSEKVHVHEERSRMGRGNKHTHIDIPRGTQREETIAAHTKDHVEVVTRDDGDDLAVRHQDATLGEAEGTRTEHDTAEVHHRITDKLNPGAAAEHRSETHGWYETVAEHGEESHVIKGNGGEDRTVKVRRVDTAAGSYVDMIADESDPTRHEQGHTRGTVVQELTRHADATKSLTVHELDGERSIGNVAGTTTMSVSAEVFTAAATTDELAVTHESIQTIEAVGGFRHTTEEHHVSTDNIDYASGSGTSKQTTKAVRELHASTIVEGHWKAELASETVADLASHDAAVAHRSETLRNDAVEVPDADIAFTPTTQIDRSIAVTQHTDTGRVLASRYEEIAAGHTRSHHTRRVDTVRDAHRGYDEADQLSTEVSRVENTVFEQGARIDAVTATTRSGGAHPLLQDTTTALTEDTRGYTTTQRWEGDTPTADAQTTDDYTAGHVVHRRQQTIESKKGWLTHATTITEVNDQLNAEGEVTDTATTTELRSVLSGGTSRATASVGGALGGAVVELIDTLTTPKKKNQLGAEPPKPSKAARVGHVVLNAAEAFTTGAATEGIAAGAVAQGAGMALAGAAAAEAVRWVAHADADADIDKSGTLSSVEKTARKLTRRRQRTVHSAANIVTTAAAAASVASDLPVVGVVAGASIVLATAGREFSGNDPSDGRTTLARTGDVLMQAGKAGSNLVTRGAGAVLRGSAVAAESAGALSVGEALGAAGTTVARIGLAEAATLVDAVVKTVQTVRAYRDPTNLSITSGEQVVREIGSSVAGGVAGVAAASVVVTQTAVALAASTGAVAVAYTMAPFVAAPIAIYLASRGFRWLWGSVFGDADQRADLRKLEDLCFRRKLPIRATDAGVRARYKKLARKCHPDRETGSHDDFLALSTDFDLIRELREKLHLTTESRESWSQHVVHVLHDISAVLGNGLGRVARLLGVARYFGMGVTPVTAPRTTVADGIPLALESAN
eukprot:m.165561 g.165561  ORF g.165561 m.165561 type:complete len:2052 (+) comp24002_c0_seq4:626-6781(+)